MTCEFCRNTYIKKIDGAEICFDCYHKVITGEITKPVKEKRVNLITYLRLKREQKERERIFYDEFGRPMIHSTPIQQSSMASLLASNTLPHQSVVENTGGGVIPSSNVSTLVQPPPVISVNERGYCMKCKQQKNILAPLVVSKETTRGVKHILQGRCQDCGGKISKLVKQ